MSIEITDFYFLFDIIFYYLVLLLIIYAIKYIRLKQNLLKSQDLIIPSIALVGIIGILIYAFIFDQVYITMMPTPKRLKADLMVMNNSNVTGTAELVDYNTDDVSIALNINNGGSFPVSINSGECEKIGPMKYTLNDIDSGYRSSVTTLENVRVDQLVKQFPLVVVISKNAEQLDDIVSCGSIVKPADFKE